MLMGDIRIRSAINRGAIELDPYIPEAMQPASIDVHLGSEFFIQTKHGRAQATDQDWQSRSVTRGAHIDLWPKDFVLGATHEILGLDRTVAARFEGKSSLGRLGLLTHITAGFIDPGFRGNITVELANVSRHPIHLYPGMRIGQLCFFETHTIASYGEARMQSHYQGQRGPKLSAFDPFEQRIDVYGEKE